LRLGLKVSQLHRPKADGPSLGKIVTHFSIYLPSLVSRKLAHNIKHKLSAQACRDNKRLTVTA